MHLDSGEDVERTWKNEWERVFRGHGASVVSPYESVHLGDEGLMFDDNTAQVRAWFHRFQLQAPGGGREADDHLGLELHLVGLLLSQALEAHAAGEDDRALELRTSAIDFARKHPLRWALLVSEPLITRSHSSIYAPVGVMLEAVTDALRRI